MTLRFRSNELLRQNSHGVFGLLALPAILAIASPSAAQTWAGGANTPTIRQLIAVDRTGETPWPYGFEDIAGNGAVFQPQEQSLDIRTAYAATAAELWVRAYVSDGAPPNELHVFVFIDADRNLGTGGPAAATNISPLFTTDPSLGGYEYVFGFRGNAVTELWQWNGTQYVPQGLMANRATAEIGTDTDPILINGATHGYAQGSIDLQLVGLTQPCNANLFVRSVNQTPPPNGDLEVGGAGACVPTACNGACGANQVCVLVGGLGSCVSSGSGGCQSDANCPGGRCVGGSCSYACTGPTDCTNGDICTGGRCVAPGGGVCNTNADCAGLICQAGRCAPCTATAQCGTGATCAPDGRCLGRTCNSNQDCGRDSTGAQLYCGPDGTCLLPGQKVEGGACVCSSPGMTRSTAPFALLLALPFLIGLRRRRSAF
ncbi:MAG TPA: hypothetical protein VGJ84_18785 [Polyangiaceae bacterium]